jgi:transposase
MKKTKQKSHEQMEIVRPHAAGIDVGGRSHFAAIGQSPDQVKEFSCYTAGLHELCAWLQSKGITDVALESTGNYWQALFVMLQDYQLNPILVNGKFTKNVKGRKSDVQDCQWIQKMHALGLLEGSFIPDLFTEKLRQFCRHRQSLLENAADYIKKIQQSLRRTNIRLDVAIRDVTGKSGQEIIKAILGGERNPTALAALANYRVKKSKEEIAEALTGDWREEYIFELKQCYEIYRFLHTQIDECDKKIENLLNEKIGEGEREYGEQRPEYTGNLKKQNKNTPAINIQKMSFQLTGGIDLSEIEGVGQSTILTLLSETGVNLNAFPSAKHFSSWLHLSPNNKISGGKTLSSKTVNGKNRLAQALRHAANAIGTNLKKGALHYFFKRIAFRKGHLQAITATARKLAVIIWSMLTHKTKYQPLVQEDYLKKMRETQLKRVQQKIKQLHIQADELNFAIG